MTVRSCRDWLPAIDRAADEGVVTEELAEHLRACSACRKEFEALRSALEVLGAGPLEDPGPGFSRRVTEGLRSSRPGWLAPVALLLAGGAGTCVALGLAFLGVLWFWFGGQRVLATAEYALADTAGRLLSLADSLVRIGVVGFLPPLAVAAALSALLVLLARTMALSWRTSPPRGSV